MNHSEETNYLKSPSWHLVRPGGQWRAEKQIRYVENRIIRTKRRDSRKRMNAFLESLHIIPAHAFGTYMAALTSLTYVKWTSVEHGSLMLLPKKVHD